MCQLLVGYIFSLLWIGVLKCRQLWHIGQWLRTLELCACVVGLEVSWGLGDQNVLVLFQRSRAWRDGLCIWCSPSLR
jgi:hypothetical protein